MEFSDYAGAIFVNDIVTNILQLRITNENYKKLAIGSDRNVFHRVVDRKAKRLNEVVKESLINLILIETKKNPKKTKELYRYFEKHLTEDIIKMIKENQKNLEEILDCAVSKFTNKNVEYTKKAISKDILKIEELLYKSVINLKNDTDVVSFFVDKLFQNIFSYITRKEEEIKNIKNINNINKKTTNILLYKKLIQKDVLILMESTKKMLVKNATEKLLIAIYTNLKLIMQWFFVEYLNDELHFVIVINKVESIFYNLEEEDNIKILSVTELLDMGWSYKEIAEKTDILFNNNVPIRDDNNTNLDTLIERMKHLPESRKLILLKNKVIGAWNFYTLFDEDFDFYIEGKSTPEIRSIDKMPIPIGGEYNIVFGAVILETKYRKTKVFKKLLYSILNHIEKLSIEGNYIRRIATKSETKEGQALIKTIGLKLYKTQDNVNTYVGTINDLLDKPYLKKYQTLKDNYNSFF